ncbi:acrosin-like isoform X2 [Oenanthe melanoleuca]|uniref:acrosin-like isoform X2 n=1 Tax=Oenanthe melanoleuca TaxID=2939378 RepID=UPI0024C1273B|nr:acrosin-like isoform X2 [Oenanthe melanoleuca]
MLRDALGISRELWDGSGILRDAPGWPRDPTGNSRIIWDALGSSGRLRDIPGWPRLWLQGAPRSSGMAPGSYRDAPGCFGNLRDALGHPGLALGWLWGAPRWPRGSPGMLQDLQDPPGCSGALWESLECPGKLRDTPAGSPPAPVTLPRVPRNVSAWRVVLGAWDLSDPGPEVQVRQVRRLRRHRALDVALLQLRRPAECSDFVQLGCVSGAAPGARLEPCYIGGWGAAGVPPNAREVLREAQVRLLQPELCNGTEAAASPQVCAEHSGGGAGACQGDAGGPLVCRDGGSERFWLVGVTSGGRGCVFTPAWHFREWVLQTLQTPATTPATTATTATTPGRGRSPGSGRERRLKPVLLQFFSVLRDLLHFLRDRAG